MVLAPFEPDRRRCYRADPALPGRVRRIVLRPSTLAVHCELQLVERRAVACLVSVGPHHDHPLCRVLHFRSSPVNGIVRSGSSAIRTCSPSAVRGSMRVSGGDLLARTAHTEDTECTPDCEHGEEDTMTLAKRMQHELDWPTWMTRRFGEMPDLFGGFFEEASMKIEEFESDGHLVIRAEMPGIDPDEDVEITVVDHRLHLRAERKEETKEEGVTGWRSEFRYGSFERTMPLPQGATDDDVTATYVDGILEIRVPIDREADTRKKIPITRAT